MSRFLEENVKTTGLEISVSAPGKAILHGEHAVVYGKLAVCGAVGLRTTVKLSEIAQENAFILQSRSLNFSFKLNLEKIRSILAEPLPLLVAEKDYNWEYPDLLNHEEVVKMAETFLEASDTKSLSSVHLVTIKSIIYLCIGILGSTGVDPKPLVINTNTDLKTGAGLGSSASFSVCIAAALIQYVKSQRSVNFSKAVYKPSHLEVDLDKFNDKDLELICKWSFCTEKIIHGMPSGLDNTTCTYGHLVEFRKGNPPFINPIHIPCTLQLLLINTNVPRQTKQLVSLVNTYTKKFPDIFNHIFDAIEAVSIEVLRNFRELSKIEGKGEIYDNLSRLCSINHNLLNALGVGHCKLDEVIEILGKAGLHGKLTGAGGGGFAICVIPPDFESNVLDKTIQELVSKGFGVDKTHLGGEGVKLEKAVCRNG